jgi:uncharacterized phage protein (TIGR02220 family)
MSRIFEIVQAMSGQAGVITIPAVYLDFVFGDPQAHLLGAILNQLVFWSGKPSSQENGWFYKTHEELAAEIRGVKPDQVRKAVDKLITKYLPGIIEEAKRQVNGTVKKHYRVDGDALIIKIFPPKAASAMGSAILPNGNGDIAEPERQISQTGTAELPTGNGDIAEPILYTDHYSDQNKQIIKTSCQPAAQTDAEVEITDQAKQALKHLNQITGSRYQPANSSLENMRARLREGHTLEELQLVIEYKQVHWGDSPKMAEYLRPATLFQPAKFEGYLLSATKWAKSGRPICVNGKWTADGEVEVDTAERDAAYRRFISGVAATKVPSELEKMVCTEASKASVRSMRSDFAITTWAKIWKECAQRQQGVKA